MRMDWTTDGLENRVENGNAQDIQTFVNHELNKEDFYSTRDQIIQKTYRQLPVGETCGCARTQSCEARHFSESEPILKTHEPK